MICGYRLLCKRIRPLHCRTKGRLVVPPAFTRPFSPIFEENGADVPKGQRGLGLGLRANGRLPAPLQFFAGFDLPS